MAIPIIKDWEKYFANPHEGLGSSYERIILNDLVFRIADTYGIHSALETPAFGFTGISGINLVGLAKRGIKVNLEDHDENRLEQINAVWQSLGLQLRSKLNTSYQYLDYPDKSIDLGFNFSAIWFVQDLPLFLAELSRVCSKCILICVPNRSGLGYKMQIKEYSPQLYPYLHLSYIDPFSIQYLLCLQGWKLIETDYIDCPPWPDIGMPKELWLAKLKGKTTSISETRAKPISILPYYCEEDPGFAKKMHSLSFVERLAPNWFKRFWAHHRYMLFIPD